MYIVSETIQTHAGSVSPAQTVCIGPTSCLHITVGLNLSLFLLFCSVTRCHFFLVCWICCMILLPTSSVCTSLSDSIISINSAIPCPILSLFGTQHLPMLLCDLMSYLLVMSSVKRNQMLPLELESLKYNLKRGKISLLNKQMKPF